MPFLIFVLAVIFGISMICLSAFSFAIGVPAAIADPTNFWAWVNIVVGFALLKSNINFSRSK